MFLKSSAILSATAILVNDNSEICPVVSNLFIEPRLTLLILESFSCEMERLFLISLTLSAIFYPVLHMSPRHIHSYIDLSLCANIYIIY